MSDNIISITGKPLNSKKKQSELDKAHNAGFLKGFDQGCNEERKVILEYLYGQIQGIEQAKDEPENKPNAVFYESLIYYTEGLIEGIKGRSPLL